MLSSALSHHNPDGYLSLEHFGERGGAAAGLSGGREDDAADGTGQGSNAVAPGWIAGEWMQRTLGDNYDRLMERRAAWTPMQWNVTGDDVAETIFSLIASNPFVTGETIVIDGGYAATS